MSFPTLFKAAFLDALPLAIVCMIYVFLPAPMNELVWCMFVGYCTTKLSGAVFKNLPHIWCSYVLGIFWALAFWFGYVLLATIGLPAWACMLLSIWVVTAILSIVNVGFLQKTWFDVIPLYFPPTFTLFACGGDFTVYPWMVLSIFIGSLMAMVCTAVWVRVESSAKKDEAAGQAAAEAN